MGPQPNITVRYEILSFGQLTDLVVLGLNIKSVDYHCIIHGISKREAINVMENIDLTKKRETLLNIKFIIIYKNG